MLDLLSFGNSGWGDEMLLGAAVTLAVAVCSLGLGLVIGTCAALAKLWGGIVLRGVAEVYTTIGRGVPELLIIYLFFFGSTIAIRNVAQVFGYTGYVELSPFLIGSFTVGLISGSYSTEVIRGAIQSIPKGQLEAGRALGMSPMLVFRRILLPQTLRFALPGLGNVWQLTLKDTSLISVMALAELMRTAHVAAGSTRQPFIFYATAGIIYLALTTVSNLAFHRAETWANRGVRRA